MPRYVYEFSTTYKARKGTVDELRAVLFRAGVLLDARVRTRAVKVRVGRAWKHGWVKAMQAQHAGHSNKLAVFAAGVGRVATYNAKQLRKAVKAGRIQLCYVLRSTGL